MDVFKRYKIRQIFFISFFAFVLLLLLTIIVVTYQLTTRESTQTIIKHQEEKLNLLSSELSSELGSFHETSIGMSRQKAFQDLITQAMEAQLKQESASTQQRTLVDLDFSNITYSVPGLHSVSVYMDNPPVNSQHPVQYHSIEEFRSSDWAVKLSDVTAGWLGEREVSLLFGTDHVISYGRNVYSPRGELTAVLVLNLRIEFIQNWIQEKGNHSSLFVLDGDAAFLSQHNNDEVPSDFRSFLQQSALRLQEQRGVSEQATITNGDLVVSSAVPSSDWTIIEVTPKEVITAGSKSIAIWLSAIGLVSIVFITLGTLFLTKKFTEPIIQLKNVMQKYPQTPVTEELPTDYKNEIGLLYDGYRELVARSDSLYTSVLEKTRRQRIAESKALQANINPHFLYNTLDQLNWRAIERGDDDMSKMLELLGNMLRIGLSKGDSILPVPKEVEYLTNYLELQKINRDNQLTYTITSDRNMEDYYIPKLTLQPFVENAVIHGFSGRVDSEIDIIITERNHSLVFEISDNGNGFPKKDLDRPKVETGGYGIKNVRERLDMYFGHDASVEVTENVVGGVAVRLEIPKVDAQYFHLLDQNE
ncbi:sensor histidine kinase [Alkalicoccobacillus murimartini]|uniref:Two-component system sensor histidine kinase YesM n=1 Tax=Alkalicoccobacillus murimartini TaxID=171685 RepID=A0ABT9YHD5_9BACI|nr:sensor histidine kinase [Alkalicoccobacillus murimartini]MDQ0207242.1 two-component system sensor histidine kinase YesM [Alkalicoccobacillus murimartini]